MSNEASHPDCIGICITDAEIGVGLGDKIAYPYPGCPAHDPEPADEQEPRR